MSFEDSEKTSRVTLQQHYNFVMNQVVSITYDLWHIIFMKILLIEDNQRTQEWVTQGLSEAGYVIDAVSDGRDGLYLALKDDYALIILDIMPVSYTHLDVYKRQAFIRLAGMVHVLPSRSISDHSAPRISPERAAVSMANSSARGETPLRSRSSFIKEPIWL